jgi:hypothetical protein
MFASATGNQRIFIFPPNTRWLEISQQMSCRGRWPWKASSGTATMVSDLADSTAALLTFSMIER